MDKIQIRNSTADFLVFTRDAKAEGVEVRVQDSEVWLTQKAIGQLFEVDRSVVTKHLQRIYAEGEADESATCANFAQVADNGKTYQYKFYSLKAIIAVGYRINSARASEFRAWATKVLETFTKQGYVLDKHHISNSGQRHDNNGYTNISNWDGMYTRTVGHLPREQQVILNTKGGARLMEGYGGYMIARYVAFNPKMDASTRHKALFVVDLWNECSNGENGYRSQWIRRKH